MCGYLSCKGRLRFLAHGTPVTVSPSAPIRLSVSPLSNVPAKRSHRKFVAVSFSTNLSVYPWFQRAMADFAMSKRESCAVPCVGTIVFMTAYRLDGKLAGLESAVRGVSGTHTLGGLMVLHFLHTYL